MLMSVMKKMILVKICALIQMVVFSVSAQEVAIQLELMASLVKVSQYTGLLNVTCCIIARSIKIGSLVLSGNSKVRS